MSFRSPKTSPIQHDPEENFQTRLSSPEKDLNRKPSSLHQQLSLPRSISNLQHQTSIGSLWTSEISLLKACGTAFEIATCLRRIEELLLDIDYVDRIKLCKSDFEMALQELQQVNDIYFTDKLIKTISSMKMKYFNEVCSSLSICSHECLIFCASLVSSGHPS
jgi:hypothetical protein